MKNENYTKRIALCLSLLLVVVGAINSCVGNVSGGVSCFAAGFLIILLFEFKVKSFKVFGLAAELQEKLDEAEEIIAKLRGISLPVSEIAIMAASQRGWDQGVLSRKKLYSYVITISNELEAMNVDKNEINNAMHAWHTVTINEMTVTITEAIRTKLKLRIQELDRLIRKNDPDSSAEAAEQLSKLFSNAHKDLFNFNRDLEGIGGCKDISTLNFLKGLIDKCSTISQQEKDSFKNEYKEHFLDLEYFIINKKLRRPDIWLSQ